MSKKLVRRTINASLQQYLLLINGCLIISTLKILSNNLNAHILVISYSELSNKHCRGYEYGFYATVEDAQEACSLDSVCHGVYDPSCDEGENDVHLCSIGLGYQHSSSSCIYQKGCKYVYYINQVIFIIYYNNMPKVALLLSLLQICLA